MIVSIALDKRVVDIAGECRTSCRDACGDEMECRMTTGVGYASVVFEIIL